MGSNRGKLFKLFVQLFEGFFRELLGRYITKDFHKPDYIFLGIIIDRLNKTTSPK